MNYALLAIIWLLSGVPSLFAMRDMVKKGVFLDDASTNAAALTIAMSGPVGLVLLVASMVVKRTCRRPVLLAERKPRYRCG